ncbi:MAG: ABC transporter ATP-binding protein [Verrucomicrobia bacterium]|nr:ABC transporter ATP-binding protein [Verrucomicrobiota bacterium]MBI3868288.1 ABC transporter ATP-binding protein [Verrucomicrobiota bacterium]
MSTLLGVLRFYRADAPRVLGVIALMLLGIVADLLKPWPLAALVDSWSRNPGHPVPFFLGGAASDPAAQVAIAALLTGGLHILRAALCAAAGYGSIRLGLEALARVRGEIVQRLQGWSWRSQQRSNVSDLVYRASWDAYSVQTLFQQGIMVFGASIVSLLLMAGVMLTLDRGLTLVALGVAPLLFLVIRFLGGRMNARGEAAREADAQVTSLVQQIIQSLPLIQSYLRSRLTSARFEASAVKARDARLSQHGCELLYSFCVATVFAIGVAGLIWVGGGRALAGALTIGQLLIFLSYLGQLYEPLNQLSHVGSTVATAGAGARRVLELLRAPLETPDVATPKDFPNLSAAPASVGPPAIEFENVVFGYDPLKPVLRGVSFSAGAGEAVAIVGPSGAGKTTLLHLLPRFFDPDSGSIRVGGVDVAQLRRDELRSRVAVLFQESALLTGTIAENIGFAKEGATRGEIVAAAKDAQAHEFIEGLPQGYDTVVGDGAARLSVGERQRVSLARAFLKDAPILLLDEPTSALDADNERLVIEGLKRLARGRTVLVVTHRPALLAIASRVLRCEGGLLRESLEGGRSRA